MPLSSATSTSIITAVLVAATLTTLAVWQHHSPRSSRKRIRNKMPQTLSQWRDPGGSYEADKRVWDDLDQVFRDGKLMLWENDGMNFLWSPDETYPLPSGFSYALPARSVPDRIGNVGCLRRFDYQNALSRIARTEDGHDVVVRVIVIGNEGHEHLKILRRLATGESSLYSNNHVLPMFAEFHFEDITFGLFPRVGARATEMYGFWAKNSVGDIVDILMQMLEALAYIHDLNVAHRDAFHNNFLVQWHPESLLTMKISPSRPRVYLIDFECAVEFPMDCPAAECISVGYPLGGSLTNPQTYTRPLPPEITSGEPYNPFKLDIWQLGSSFSDFKSTIPTIDEILLGLTDSDPTRRPDVKVALNRLQTVVHSMTPESLCIPPVVTRDD